MITWRGRYGENFHLSVRRLIYGKNGTIVPTKWLSKQVQFIRVDLYSNSTPAEVVFGTAANFTGEIHFTGKTESYEIYLSKITSTGDVDAGLSIFMDGKNNFVLGTNHNLISLIQGCFFLINNNCSNFLLTR